MKEEKAPLWAGRQSGISRSEVTESVEYGDEAGGVEEMRGLGEDGWKRGGKPVRKNEVEAGVKRFKI